MFVLISILLLFQTYPEVKVYGALRDIMHNEDYAGKVKLNLLGPMEDLIGVGAVEGLDGEITIIDGQALVSSYADGMYSLDKSTNVDAALLVVSDVSEWEEHRISNTFENMGEFNAWLTQYLSDQKRNIPTPFKLRIPEGRASWHVITPPQDGEDHKTAGKKYTNNGPFEVVGFYSQSHMGVFTHQGSVTHMHYVGKERKFTGHLDEVKIPASFVLLLPL